MKDWKKISIGPGDVIIKGLELLNASGSQFIVVVNEANQLLGSVTDGDIRRGLLKGIQLQNELRAIMNSKPFTLPAHSTKQNIFQLMKEKQIHHLPLVNERNEIIEIVSLDELLKVEKKENHVVLMAGGLGSRLASLTTDCPKPMLKIGGKPILETIIETFKEHGFYKFIISVNYKSEIIEEYFKDGKHLDVEISYIKEKTRLGTAGALSLYETNGLPFVVMNGDLLTKVNFTDLINFHSKNNNIATMGLRQYEHQIPFGVVQIDQDKVVQIEEKPIRRYFVNGGIYVLNPEVVRSIPLNTFYDMPTFFEDLISKNNKIGAYPFFEYWLDIGRMDDFERAHNEFLEIFK
jgi:dTDP-glucose pyrophosphorylase/predicted transcriptional regulator